jgi:hypothetical protein
MESRGEAAIVQEEVEVQPEAETPPARKPYQKPEFRRERIFETMALACGKISSTQKQCRFRTRSS